MFGTQKSSKSFWAQEVLKELGISELSKLGDFDPIYFSGWDQLKILNNEIKILEDNRAKLKFDEDQVTEWIMNLKFCCDKLLKTVTKDSIPNLMIG
jgi:ABC-type Fe3+-citrate transport system substrate-binding protein